MIVKRYINIYFYITYNINLNNTFFLKDQQFDVYFCY